MINFPLCRFCQILLEGITGLLILVFLILNTYKNVPMCLKKVECHEIIQLNLLDNLIP